MPSRERTAICLPFLQIGLRLVLDQNSNSGYGGIYLKTTLQTYAVKVKEQPFGLLTSYHNEVSKILPSENQAVKLSSYKNIKNSGLPKLFRWSHAFRSDQNIVWMAKCSVTIVDCTEVNEYVK